MIHVKGLIYYIGPPLNAPLTPPESLDVNADGKISRIFRQALLKSHEAFEVNLQVDQYPLLHCKFARCGQAAGVANWWRDGVSEAISAYLPGVDEDDEYIVERALALKPYPITLHRWHEILKAKRPVYATFLLTPRAAKDRLIGPVASALGFSFFSILGVADEGKEPQA